MVSNVSSSTSSYLRGTLVQGIEIAKQVDTSKLVGIINNARNPINDGYSAVNLSLSSNKNQYYTSSKTATTTSTSATTQTVSSSAKTQFKSTASTIGLNSFISIDNDLMTSVLKNATAKDLKTYANSTSSNLSTNIDSLVTLLKNTAAVSGLDENTSEEFSDLAESISISKNTILANYNSSKYAASMISKYKS